MAKTARWLRRGGRRILFVALEGVARVAGLRHAPMLGKVIGELEYRIAWRRRQRCAHDMALALGRPVGDARVAMQLRHAHHINAQAAIEILALLAQPHDARMLWSRLVVAGEEHLQAALAAGRGAILLGTHAGNGVLLAAGLAAAGWPMSVVYRQARMAPAGFLGRGFARYGIEAIAANEGLRAYGRMRTAVTSGRILFVTLDQGVKHPQDGITVRFLGKLMSLAAGPAQLARHTRAPVLPVLATGYDGAWQFRIEPALPSDAGGLEAVIERLARASERQALLHPALWSWHHRRWRKLPLAPATMSIWNEDDPACPNPAHRP
ncbi:MAG: lysophospholipid acyltransferase family protein [Burkholderiales bacterium]|nr:lysophospholipid acyltransferase family protein [Burkholderiales bacterium]